MQDKSQDVTISHERRRGRKTSKQAGKEEGEEKKYHNHNELHLNWILIKNAWQELTSKTFQNGKKILTCQQNFCSVTAATAVAVKSHRGMKMNSLIPFQWMNKRKNFLNISFFPWFLLLACLRHFLSSLNKIFMTDTRDELCRMNFDEISFEH